MTKHQVQVTVDDVPADLSLGQLREKVAQLESALVSRVNIELAKGALAERHRTTPEAAFAALRSYARSNRVRIHDVAADVVAGLYHRADPRPQVEHQ